MDARFLVKNLLESYADVARDGQRSITTRVAVLIVKGSRAQRSILGHLRRSSWNNLTLALNVCVLCTLAAMFAQPGLLSWRVLSVISVVIARNERIQRSHELDFLRQI